MKLNRISIIMLTLIALIATSAVYVYAADENGIIKPDFTGFSIFPAIEGFDHPDITNYVWEGGGIFENAIAILASSISMIGTFILRIGIMILDFGMHPTFINGIVEEVTVRAQDNGWNIVKVFLPIICIVAFYLFGKDYVKGAASTAMRRGVILLVTLCLLGAAFAMPTTTLTKALTGVSEFSNWMASKLILAFTQDDANGGDTIDQSNRFIYVEIWNQLVYNPYEIGQVGEPGIAITEEEAIEINTIIDPYKVVAGVKWADVMTWFSPSSDEREDIVDYYIDQHEENYEYASNPYFRLLIGLINVLVGVVAALYLIIMGGILLVLSIAFIGIIVAGLIILPLSLIPSEQIMAMKYLMRIVGLFTAMLFINLYIGVTFILVRLLFMDNGLPFLVAMLLLLIVFIFAIIVFFILLSKLQTVPGLKSMNDVMKPVRRAGEDAKRRVKRRFSEKRQDKRFKRRLELAEDYGADEDDNEESDDNYDPDNSGPGHPRSNSRHRDSDRINHQRSNQGGNDRSSNIEVTQTEERQREDVRRDDVDRVRHRDDTGIPNDGGAQRQSPDRVTGDPTNSDKTSEDIRTSESPSAQQDLAPLVPTARSHNQQESADRTTSSGSVQDPDVPVKRRADQQEGATRTPLEDEERQPDAPGERKNDNRGETDRTSAEDNVHTRDVPVEHREKPKESKQDQAEDSLEQNRDSQSPVGTEGNQGGDKEAKESKKAPTLPSEASSDRVNRDTEHNQKVLPVNTQENERKPSTDPHQDPPVVKQEPEQVEVEVVRTKRKAPSLTEDDEEQEKGSEERNERTKPSDRT